VNHEEDAMKLAEVERRYKRLEQRLRAEGRAEGRAKGRAEGRAEGKAEGRVEGEAKGKVAALLAVLEARGVPTSQAAQRRIERCRDARALDQWLKRAPFVERAAQLFR
jgi:flagellar biosynthesis/type III secretory pathway protein FliH